MGTKKGLAVALSLAGVMFSAAAIADDNSTTTVTEDKSFERLPDGATVSTDIVTSITVTPPGRTKFGKSGQIVLGLTRLAGFSWSRQDLTDNATGAQVAAPGVPVSEKPTSTAFSLFRGNNKSNINAALVLPRFALDFFVVDNFSIGLGAVFGYRRDDPSELTQAKDTKIPVASLNAELDVPVGIHFTGETKDISAGAEFLLGYAIDINEWLTWWPKVGVEYEFDQVIYNMTAQPRLTAGASIPIEMETKQTFNGLWVEVLAPFVFMPASNWGILVAPTVDIPVLGDLSVNVEGTQGGAPLNAEIELTNKTLQIGAFIGALGYW